MGRVSVVVAASEATPFIGEAIDSVFLQKYPNLELVVVGDSSREDGQLERVLAPYGNKIVFVKNIAGGLAAARNAGFAAATGELIAILDPNDIWEPDYLRIQLDALQSSPGVSVACCNAAYFGDTYLHGKLYSDLYPSRGPVTFESVCLEHCNVFGAALFRRDRLLAVGGYDARLPACGIDLDLFLRLLHADVEVVHHGHPVYRARQRAGAQLRSDEARLCAVLVDVLTRLDQSLDLTEPQRSALHTRLRRLRSRLSLIAGKKALNAGDWSQAREMLRDASENDGTVMLSLVRLAAAVSPGTLSRLMRWRAGHIAG